MRVLYFTFFVIFADQVTKLFIKGFSIPFLGVFHQGMELNSSFELIDDFVRFTFVENPGMAFGLDFGGKLFFSIFSIIAAVGILYYLFKVRKESLILRVPLALILGGAIGNLIDRLFYGVLYGEAPLFFGKVVDFIDMKFFRMEFFGFHLTRWPVFNISDIAVTAGVLILIIFHKRITESMEGGRERILQVPVPVLKSSNGYPNQAGIGDQF